VRLLRLLPSWNNGRPFGGGWERWNGYNIPSFPVSGVGGAAAKPLVALKHNKDACSNIHRY